ncbi:calcium homeostasis modulator protein 6-like [Trichosurus vulpecula]|uniref:calcium homeostasis modulator protein 6-like n=1 Tax=Trichosurus vulpecula TaxID=9337 RepID=UPI00186ADDCC|nr:calcium homeostasis modulator protein 6-like [Trichosurus vulpecula]
MDKYRLLLGHLTKHHKTLGMSFLSLLTAGGESLFSNVVFQCPCNANWSLPYSLFFLLVPALILLLLGYLLSTKAARLMTGCCARDQGDTSEEIPDKPGYSRMKMCCWRVTCSRITLTAALAPFTWIAVALLGGSYYECAASGNEWMQKYLCQGQKPNCTKEVLQMPCQKTNSKEIQGLLNMLRAQSQMLGWLITLLMVCCATAKFCTFCKSQVSFLQLKFLKIYKKQEKEILTTESKKYATELAERNVKCFFENVRLDSVRIPGSDEWKEISEVIEPTDTAYSALHEYANNRPVRNYAHQNPASD